MRIALVRISRAITLSPYIQSKSSVFSATDGLVSLEPKRDLSVTYNFRMANGVAAFSSERNFHIFLSNFAKSDRRLPKGMVFFPRHKDYTDFTKL